MDAILLPRLFHRAEVVKPTPERLKGAMRERASPRLRSVCLSVVAEARSNLN